MSNPFLKKNPFLSLWLSAAHSVGNRIRGQVTAEAKRQAAAAVATVLAPAKPRKRRRRSAGKQPKRPGA